MSPNKGNVSTFHGQASDNDTQATRHLQTPEVCQLVIMDSLIPRLVTHGL